MSRIGLHYKIFNSLLSDANENQRFMDLGDIAYSIWGDAYTTLPRKSQNELQRMIKQQIHVAKSLAKQNGKAIITKRKPTRNNPEIKWQAIGWKIANGKSDALYVIDEQEFSVNRQNAIEIQKQELLSYAKEKGILTNGDVNQLKIS